MNHVELAALAQLREIAPELIAGFQHYLPEARLITTQRLLTAMLRERLLVYSTDNDNCRIKLDNGDHITARLAPDIGFSRLPITGPIVRLSGTNRDDGHEINSPDKLIRMTSPEGISPGTWIKLAEVAVNSAINLALGQAAHQYRANHPTGKEHTWTPSGTSSSNVDPMMTHLVLEALCVDGHNLHPLNRARLPMTTTESFRYSAEGLGAVSLTFVAVRKQLIQHSTDSQQLTIPLLIGEHFPQLTQAHREELAAHGVSADQFDVVPMHPWQREHALSQSYTAELESGDIVPLTGTLPTTPTISLRTLVTAAGQRQRRLVIKTAIAATFSATRRNISPASTVNGPMFSRVLQRICASEPGLYDRVVPVVELAGSYFTGGNTEPAPDLAADRDRNLSCIVREDFAPYVTTGEVAITGCVFYAISPTTGRPILADLVIEHASRNGISKQRAAMDWLACYAQLLSSALITLLVRYGIGLDAHLQNVIVVIRNGMVTRLLIRDFAGLRIHLPRLASAGISLTAHSASITVTNDIDEVRRKAFHSCVQANVAEVIALLVHSFGLDPHDCWALIWRQLDRVFTELHRDPELTDRVQPDRDALSAATLEQKAFVRMWLAGGQEQYVPVTNPLHEAAR